MPLLIPIELVIEELFEVSEHIVEAEIVLALGGQFREEQTYKSVKSLNEKFVPFLGCLLTNWCYHIVNCNHTLNLKIEISYIVKLDFKLSFLTWFKLEKKVVRVTLGSFPYGWDSIAVVKTNVNGHHLAYLDEDRVVIHVVLWNLENVN